MPGLRLFKNSFYSHIGANQTIGSGTIKMGSLKGKGSSTRMFNYCKQKSPNPSECINQFVTLPQNGCGEIDISSIATLQNFLETPVWIINPNTIINNCQTLNYSSTNTYIFVLGGFTNNGTINISNSLFAFLDGTSINNGTININSGELYNAPLRTTPILNNFGTINVNNGSTFLNASIFNNNGQINNLSSLINSGGVINNTGGEINNLLSSLINNTGSSSNIIDNTNGIINNSGYIYNGNNINCTSGTIIGSINGNPVLNECLP
jgi:hypothetical protein